MVKPASSTYSREAILLVTDTSAFITGVIEPSDSLFLSCMKGEMQAGSTRCRKRRK